ncbi:hypothetical protein TRIP_C90094 [Candidatus Zixiibacteriota bacterium]|nr:hypothetical protein TRIP_C90094 [candidate division Zixibacteria bacterium]
MATIIIFVGGIALVAGIILILASLWYRKPDHPSITGGGTVKHALFWRYKNFWEPKGYKLYNWGMILFAIGLILEIVYYSALV